MISFLFLIWNRRFQNSLLLIDLLDILKINLRKVIFILIGILACPSTQLWAQGCSDAGFCSMGAMKPDQHYDRRVKLKLRALELSQYFGRTKFGNIIYSTTLDLNVGINRRNSLQVKLPYTFVTGNDGWDTQGIGDISLSYTYLLVDRRDYQINATLGAKIPTNNSNKLFRGRPLPMYYQTSLGTYDLVMGLAFINREWLLAFGYQQPFNNNGNQFTVNAWDDTPGEARAQLYHNSSNLNRRADVMLRLERNFRFSRFNFNVGLLSIYRFRPDLVTLPGTDQEIEEQDSEGLALSLLFGATYRFSTRHQIKALFGDRLIEREINPDGLSREQVFTIAYQIIF